MIALVPRHGTKHPNFGVLARGLTQAKPKNVQNWTSQLIKKLYHCILTGDLM